MNKGQKYGEKFFYKWWKRACDNLGVESVDLYGGTRHSSAAALREHFSPEQIKQGTMHQTNKAFERYFRIGADDIRLIYNEASKKNLSSTMLKKTDRYPFLDACITYNILFLFRLNK